MPIIVDTTTAVTLVGGADLRAEVLTKALSLAPGLVAADGGADHLLAAGLQPQAVIGDMDSISGAARLAFAAVLHPVAEQMSTDFDKALRHISAPLVIAVGVTGGRLDHELAVLHTLLRHPDRRCVVLGPESLVVLCPPVLTLDLTPGLTVSLFPMGPVRVRSTGLRWPTDHLRFAPGQVIGTSNQVAGPLSGLMSGPVVLHCDAPLMLLILPASALAAVVTALQAAAAPWPVHAG